MTAILIFFLHSIHVFSKKYQSFLSQALSYINLSRLLQVLSSPIFQILTHIWHSYESLCGYKVCDHLLCDICKQKDRIDSVLSFTKVNDTQVLLYKGWCKIFFFSPFYYFLFVSCLHVLNFLSEWSFLLLFKKSFQTICPLLTHMFNNIRSFFTILL